MFLHNQQVKTISFKHKTKSTSLNQAQPAAFYANLGDQFLRLKGFNDQIKVHRLVRGRISANPPGFYLIFKQQENLDEGQNKKDTQKFVEFKDHEHVSS